MQSASPVVSIGMSVRNNRSTLALSLRSVLSQTFEDWELLLIDDGSTDGTTELARRFAGADTRIKLSADGRCRGLPARLNEAIDASRGAFFARMDGDDVSYPDRLRRQVDYMRCHPEVDLVGTSAVVFGAGGTAIGKRACGEHHEQICARPHAGFPMIHPTYFGRIDYFRNNRYRESAIRCEDQDMLLRSFGKAPGPLGGGLAKSQDQDLLIHSYSSARFANVPEILLGYREEEINLKKIFASRYYMSIAFWIEFCDRGRPILACRAVAGQAWKALVDLIAVRTGMNYRILRHRARPVTESELRRWEGVWADLRDSEQRTPGGRSEATFVAEAATADVAGISNPR